MGLNVDAPIRPFADDRKGVERHDPVGLGRVRGLRVEAIKDARQTQGGESGYP